MLSALVSLLDFKFCFHIPRLQNKFVILPLENIGFFHVIFDIDRKIW